MPQKENHCNYHNQNMYTIYSTLLTYIFSAMTFREELSTNGIRKGHLSWNKWTLIEKDRKDENYCKCSPSTLAARQMLWQDTAIHVKLLIKEETNTKSVTVLYSYFAWQILFGMNGEEGLSTKNLTA